MVSPLISILVFFSSQDWSNSPLTDVIVVSDGIAFRSGCKGVKQKYCHDVSSVVIEKTCTLYRVGVFRKRFHFVGRL